MLSAGKKCVCGGREFWCVGFAGSEVVLMRSGAAVTEVRATSFDKSFCHVGPMEVGGDPIARETSVDVAVSEKYTVTGIDKGVISFPDGAMMDLNVLIVVF